MKKLDYTKVGLLYAHCKRDPTTNKLETETIVSAQLDLDTEQRNYINYYNPYKKCVMAFLECEVL